MQFRRGRTAICASSRSVTQDYCYTTSMNELPATQTQLPPLVAESFGISPEIVLLAGGVDLKTFRSGDVVLRKVGDNAREVGEWNAQLFDRIQENGFRVAKPIRARDGSWMVDGWIAEHFLEGSHATAADMPEIIEAVTNFHRALVGIPLPEYRTKDNSMWDRADIWAWGEVPDDIDPELYAMALELQALKQPVALPDQLIHGDLNLNNILIAENLPPAIIDLTPYFHPAEFALAVTAYWEGPYKGNIEILEQFRHIPEFKQMLIRAGLRMMLTQQDSKQAKGLDEYRKANEIIKQFVYS